MSESAFLRLIREQPGEDAPRLVFADWLDEHGQPARAEFIRVGCQLAALSPSDGRRPALEDRHADLLAEHEEAWLAPWSRDFYRWEWSRGMLASITQRWEASLAEVGHLFERFPLEDVHFSHLGEHFADLADTRHLEAVRGLHLGHIMYPEDDLRTVLTSPRLAGLRRLTGLMFEGEEMPDPVPFLANLPQADQLERLGLSLSADDQLRELLLSTRFAGLTGLDLDLNEDSFAGEALCLLTEPEHAQRWTELSLSINAVSRRLMAHLERCQRLEKLYLNWPDLRPDRVAMPTTLRELRVFSSSDTVSPLPDLCQQSALEGLRMLSLSLWGEADLRSEEDWADLQRVMDRLPGPCLQLSIHRSTPGMLANLARMPRLDRVVSLEFNADEADDASLATLLNRADLSGLHQLKMRIPALSVEQVRLLADSSLMTRLRDLDLFQTRLSDEAVEVLLAEAPLRWLDKLNLGSTGIGDRAVAILADWPGLARLRSLGLWFNAISPRGIRPLAESERLRPLTWLQLEQNHVGQRQLQRSDLGTLPTRLGHRLSI